MAEKKIEKVESKPEVKPVVAAQPNVVVASAPSKADVIGGSAKVG